MYRNTHGKTNNEPCHECISYIHFIISTWMKKGNKWRKFKMRQSFHFLSLISIAFHCLKITITLFDRTVQSLMLSKRLKIKRHIIKYCPVYLIIKIEWKFKTLWLNCCKLWYMDRCLKQKRSIFIYKLWNIN